METPRSEPIHVGDVVADPAVTGELPQRDISLREAEGDLADAMDRRRTAIEQVKAGHQLDPARGTLDDYTQAELSARADLNDAKARASQSPQE